MKRQYKKPYLLVESYQIDAAIAAPCTSESNGSGVALGLYMIDCVHESMWYADGVCLLPVNDETCYHGPYTTNGLTFIYS